jgi:hypothetical protein
MVYISLAAYVSKDAGIISFFTVLSYHFNYNNGLLFFITALFYATFHMRHLDLYTLLVALDFLF